LTSGLLTKNYKRQQLVSAAKYESNMSDRMKGFRQQALQAGEDDDQALKTVVSWVQATASPQTTLQSDWVPGASVTELERLALLGKVVGRFHSSKSAPPRWVAQIAEVQQWLQAGSEAPAAVNEAVARIAAAGVDTVAALYASLVHPTSRRRLGTFFTPPAEAQWMIDRWDELFGSPSSIVDVGAGVGAFTMRAHHKWPTAYLYPVDVNPVTLGLFALQPEDRDTEVFSSRIIPQLADYAVWVQEKFASIAGPRLILGNPPYTRSQLIPLQERVRLRTATKGLCGSRASLSALMLGISLSSLGANDGICLLLPAQWLESDYASELRTWLWTHTSRHVELHLFDARLFQDAQVDAVCLLVGPEQAAAQSLTTGFATSIASQATPSPLQHDRSLSQPSNWRAMFTDSGSKSVPSGNTLSYYATIRRGIATGSNQFFTLSSADVSKWGLEPGVLRPYLQRTNDFNGKTSVDLADIIELPDTRKQHILVVDASGCRSQPVEAYLEHGKTIGANMTYLASKRPNWFDLSSEMFEPDVIVAAATRTRFTLLTNAARAMITNNLYGLSWHETTPQELRVAILQWLQTDDGQERLLEASRTQAEGLRKMEVRSLGSVTLPPHITDQTPSPTAASTL
jgi:hypothetical protein